MRNRERRGHKQGGLPLFSAAGAGGPGAEGEDDGFEGAAARGEGVVDARGDLGVDGAGDEAVGFELAELLDEDFLGDGGKGAVEFGEAPGAGEELPEDGDFPFAADHGESGFGGTAGVQAGHVNYSILLDSITAMGCYCTFMNSRGYDCA